MKTIEMCLEPEFFNLVAKGKKSVEFRKYDKKRQGIKKGDNIRFIDTEDKQTVVVEVFEVLQWKTSVSMMVACHPITKIGTSKFDTIKKLRELYPLCRDFCAIWFKLIE